MVVHYRAAIEALSAMLHWMSLSSEPRVTADTLLQRLALDLYSDDVIDNLDRTQVIGAIDINMLSSDPMTVQIPNTEYLVQDIISLMDDERALIGNSGNTTFFKDDIVVSLRPASLDANQETTPVTDPEPLLDASVEIDYSAPVDNPVDAIIVAASLLFSVDFENRVTNSTYTEAQLIEDFNANNRDGGIEGPNYGHTTIVSDPANTGRGNVLRILHPKGIFSVGASFKARFAPDNENKKGSERHDDIYFAYDVYLSPNTEFVPMHKLPGLVTGTLLEASHQYPDEIWSDIEPEGVKAFTALMSIYTSAAWPEIPDGESALVNFTYDTQRAQGNDFLNTSDPDEDIDNNLNTNVDKMYLMPKGRWVTIEQRVKMNTVDSNDAYDPNNDLKDGLIQIWVDGELMLSRTHLWRWTDTMKVDGFWFLDYHNETSELTNPPSEDQYVYHDNLRVSTQPITH